MPEDTCDVQPGNGFVSNTRGWVQDFFVKKLSILALAATALLLQAGCKHAPPPAPSVVAPPMVSEAPPLPRQKPKIRLRKPAPVVPAMPAVPEAAITAPPPDIVVVGRSQADVKAALGEPSIRVQQGAGQTWTWRGDHCSLNLIFFFDTSRNDFYALDRRLEGTDGTEADAQRCLNDLHMAWAGK